MPKRHNFSGGPQNVPTSSTGRGTNSMRRAIAAATGAGQVKPAQTRGAQISKSPTIDSVSGYTSDSGHLNVGSGTRNRVSAYPTGVSAPQQAREMGRAPPGWLK